MDETGKRSSGEFLKGLLAALLWLSWQAIRWPLLALLIVLEPIVRVTLGLFALFGTLTTFFWRFAVDPPGFPFFTVLALSLVCIPALVLYYFVLQILTEC